MSTTVTVAVAKPNHLPINVFYEAKNGAQWSPESAASVIPVGGAHTFMVHGSRRLVIEEVVG